ncbi:hypothetical protein V6x_20100 [Gimesia chilikensis]|uniref:Uncharacterized protein n=1 Tax=Gimesia chilikensis TaxID=2605989 RepID=A0A517WAP0_9PLAN|nr:hypothetical protein V6x_20100 [Gimesia chilikensis]
MKIDHKLDAILQPLRITPGWCVDFNRFTILDPAIETAGYFYGTELFSASNRSSSKEIKLCFEPEGDPNGQYVLSFYKVKWNSHTKSPDFTLIRSILSTSRTEIVEAIEIFMSIEVTCPHE